MKYFSKIALVLITCISFLACSENENSFQDKDIVDFKNLNKNLKDFSKSFEHSLSSEEKAVTNFNYFFKKNKRIFDNDNKSLFLSKGFGSQNELTISMPSHYNNLTRSFLLEYYSEMTNAYDYEVLDVITKFQSKLNSNIYTQKEQIQSILDASRISFETIENIYNQNDEYQSRGGFLSCMRKNAGKKIGRGIAGGAIVGAIKGATIGAIGGTVALPGVGTAAGAVGGAVFGAAKGAVVGGVVAAFWASADCLKAIQTSNTGYTIVDPDFIKDEEGKLIIDSAIFDVEIIKLKLNP